MNSEAFRLEVPPRMSEPPNQSTMAMAVVPRNSLMGWASDWRRAIRLLSR